MTLFYQDFMQIYRGLAIANYYIGVAFFEVFSFIKKIGVANGKTDHLIDRSNKLVKNPSMPQKEADKISLDLIKAFVGHCVNPTNFAAQKSLEAINDEMGCLTNNKDEAQEMVDTRLAIIFQEIADLLQGQGETLFLDPEKKK